MRSIYLASGILLAGLVGSVYRPGGTGTTPSAPPAQTKEQPARPKPTITEWQSALCVLSEGPPDSKGNCGVASEYRPLSSVIAFVPDPYMTRLRLQFDRSIEAITWAAQDAGFTSFRAQWVPWRVTEPAELSRLVDRKLSEYEQEELRKQPGLLVFTGTRKSLVVWLVGESPTHGFNPDQFAAALKHAQNPPGIRSRGVPPPTIRIVGPCFSGTFPPLFNALKKKWKDPRFAVSILSGTANHTESENWFVSRVSPHPGSRFNSFSHNDGLRLQALRDYLRRPLVAASSMAVLSEDETDFGVAVNLRGGIRFPRGIAYLRNAYQTDPGLLSLSVQDSATPRRSLQLSLKSPEIGHDSVPEFSEQTPVSAEAQVRQIADTLHHDRTRIAVVIATDVLDTLFVGKFLKLSAPNTRQIFLDSDILRTRTDDYPSLEGSLEVTSYPQLSARYRWTQDLPTVQDLDLRRLAPFSGEFEEGLYSAASATFPETAPSQAPASNRVTLPNYRPLGSRATDPPLWLTVLGNGEQWPLAILNDPPLSYATALHDRFLLPPPGEAMAKLESEPPPRIWTNLFLLGLLLTLAYLGVFLYAQWPHGRPLGHDRLWSDLWLKPREPVAYARAFYLLCLTLSLAAAWLALTSGILGYQRDDQNVPWYLLLGVLGPALLLASLAFWLTYRTLTLKPAEPLRVNVAHRWHYQLLTIVPWLLFAGFVNSLYSLLTPAGYFKSFFYSYRSIEIGSGVSPTLPLLFVFLGLACWSVVQLQRRVFSEERYQLLPSLAENQIVIGIGEVVKQLEEYLVATFPRPFWGTGPAGVMLFGAAYWITDRLFKSLEGPAYDCFYGAAAAALATLLFLCTWRFWKCWKLLQLFLEQLALHPIREAFSALPAEYSWSPIWQSSPRKRSYALHSRTVECLRELRDVSGQPITTADKPLSHVRKLMRFVARRHRERLKLHGDLQTALQDTAQNIVNQLNPWEWTKGRSDTLQRAEDEARKNSIRWPGDDQAEREKPATLGKEFVALRFLHFIRYVMLQLRNLLTFIMFGFVMLTLSLGSYPFGSPQLLAWTLVGCLVLTGIPVVWAFLEMERDATLSSITNTKPGQVEKGSFLLRVTSFGILPLLSVLASHFPSIGQYLYSWLQPLVKSMH